MLIVGGKEGLRKGIGLRNRPVPIFYANYYYYPLEMEI